MKWFSSLLMVSSVLSVSVIADEATPVDDLKVAKGFKVERLYSVPNDKQGSWVNMCLDNKGRLIVSDQYGKLYRMAIPKPGSNEQLQPEPIELEIGQAHGLLYAFDSLYVMVSNNAYSGQGLYRIRDTDGDDKYDEVKLLRKMVGTGEHGPHAILLSPDGKSLTIVAGNRTDLTKVDSSRVPQVWDEDLLLPRAYGRGFMKGTLAPGGWIAKTDPDGKTWELIATGFRNQFDAAYNRMGDLFTYDADMEWDVNTPWYRPTRVCLVASGVEFGWRNGSGKWPAYFTDSVPPVINIGPGSPTGVTFGYGAKFPKKYQHAFFISDWSYGKLYAVHMTPDGAGYSATKEEFITGTPLPLTDVIINPADGAMYFAIGGRRVQSGLYRVTWAGEEPAEDDAKYHGEVSAQTEKMQQQRRMLEEFHTGAHPQAVEAAWKYLGSSDRFLQTAARIAIEHQPVSEWQEKALSEQDPKVATIALIALARHAEKSAETQNAILNRLHKIDLSQLNEQWRLGVIRAWQLAFTRFGEPQAAQAKATIGRLDSLFPSVSERENAELLKLLVYLQADSAAKKGVQLLVEAPTQEEQINYAKSLRHLKAGWTPELQDSYFKWFTQAATYRGGASFTKFVAYIKKDAVDNLSKQDKTRLKSILEAKPQATGPVFAKKDRPVIKEYTVEDLMPALEEKLAAGGRDYRKGRQLFGEASCFACHRFDQQGGAVGPDLTALAGRFSKKDLLTSVIEPSKAISDQYEAFNIVTSEGQQVIGRIVNLSGDTYRISTNMLNPDELVTVKRGDIEEMSPSKVSMMPKGLLDRFTEEEIADLMAYLLSRGDSSHPMFAKPANANVEK